MALLNLEEITRVVPILGDLGIEFESAGEGRCRCKMPVSPRVINPFGVLHGGITMTLADTGMGVAIFTLLQPEERSASVELSMRYLLPAKEGRIVAECRVIRRSNRFAIAEAEVFDGEGELIAVAGGSYYISRNKG